MKSKTIAVVQYGQLWRVIRGDGRPGEPLPYRDALKYAERLARLARWQGLDVEVLVHQGGELRPHLQLSASANVAALSLNPPDDR